MSDRLAKLTDRAIRLVSPRWAATRAHFRRMVDDSEYSAVVFAMLHARGYRAAKTGSKGGWLGSGKSADAEILEDLPSLRNRSRELGRDDPLASGLVRTFVDNIVGTGLRAQAQTGDPEKNAQLEAVFSARRDQLHPAESLTYAQTQRMKLRKLLEDGDVLVKQAKRNPGEPVWFEIVEADRLATPLGDKPRDEKGEIREGVEKDRDGVVVAYWIRKGHPGDIHRLPVAGADDFERVEASACLLLRRVERPGQTRGVPMCHAILQDLRDLDLLLLASLKRVQIAACLSVFIKSNMPIEEILGKTARKYGYGEPIDQTLEPGMIFALHQDEEIQTLLPNFPTPELAPFIIMLARRIGAAVGVCWQVVLKDFSDSTYSSARTDLLETWRTYDSLRSEFVTTCATWEWVAVLEDARLRGDPRMHGITSDDLRKVVWFGDARQWVDPLKEGKAVELELLMHLSTLDEVWLRQGKDPDKMWEKLAHQKEKLEQLGLKLERGNAPTIAKGELPADEDDDDEEDKARELARRNGRGLLVGSAT